MRALAVTGAALLLAACSTPPSHEDTGPAVAGTPTRPQLDAATAARHVRGAVLGVGGRGRAPVRDGWDPLADRVILGDQVPRLHYRVDPSSADGQTVFATVQAAINQAHVDALAGRHTGSARLYIGIAPGRYVETVYVPPTPLPLTLWGLGGQPGDVRIEYPIDAGLPLAEYVRRLGPVYTAPGMHADIAASYRQCARPEATRTSCTAVMWVGNDGFQARQLTVANSHDSRLNVARQAVAFKSEGADRVHLERVHLLSYQDTLYLRSKGDDHIARTFVHDSLIEGDVDFIFGAGTAYFENSEIRWVGARRGQPGGYVGAPNTSLHVPYGFVFERCRFTASGPSVAGVALARQWFSGARCSPYGEPAGRCRIDASNVVSDASTLPQTILETVGKMIVMRSELGPHLLREAPWAPWHADRRAANHRPAQFDSDDFWRRLEGAGIDPRALGLRRAFPAEPYLGEFRNRGPGARPDGVR